MPVPEAFFILLLIQLADIAYPFLLLPKLAGHKDKTRAETDRKTVREPAAVPLRVDELPFQTIPFQFYLRCTLQSP